MFNGLLQFLEKPLRFRNTPPANEAWTEPDIEKNPLKIRQTLLDFAHHLNHHPLQLLIHDNNQICLIKSFQPDVATAHIQIELSGAADLASAAYATLVGHCHERHIAFSASLQQHRHGLYLEWPTSLTYTLGREYFRVCPQQNTPVHIHSGAQDYEALVLDLSEGGMALLMSAEQVEMLFRDAMTGISITVGNQTIECNSMQIRSQQEIRSRGVWRIGLAFTGLYESERLKIRKLLFAWQSRHPQDYQLKNAGFISLV